MTWRAARPAIIALALALVASGCLPEASTPSPSPTPTDAPEATPVVSRVDLGVSLSYAGWVLDLGTATATLDPNGGNVVVPITFHNMTTADDSFGSKVRLLGAKTPLEPDHDTKLPDVAAGGSAAADLRYDVIGAFDLAKAALVVGEPSDHQATVPFADPAGATVLTPRTIAPPASPTATGGSIRLTMTGGVVRADLPDWSIEMPRDLLALTVTYDATYVGTFAGGASFTADNVGLELPDGKIVAPRRDGRSSSVVLLMPGKTQKALSSRFEVPSPAGGTYGLIVRDGTSTAPIWFAVLH